jgi:putative endonuclease
MPKSGYVYVMASTTRTLYIGVTSDLEWRVWEHKTHFLDGHTKRYDIAKLVYIAEFARMDDARSLVRRRRRARRGRRRSL